MSKSDAWNSASLGFTHAAMAHIKLYIVQEFGKSINSKKASMSPRVQALMIALLKLMTLHWIIQNTGDFLLYAKFSVRWTDLRLDQVCTRRHFVFRRAIFKKSRQHSRNF